MWHIVIRAQFYRFQHPPIPKLSITKKMCGKRNVAIFSQTLLAGRVNDYKQNWPSNVVCTTLTWLKNVSSYCYMQIRLHVCVHTSVNKYVCEPPPTSKHTCTEACWRTCTCIHVHLHVFGTKRRLTTHQNWSARVMFPFIGWNYTIAGTIMYM